MSRVFSQAETTSDSGPAVLISPAHQRGEAVKFLLFQSARGEPPLRRARQLAIRLAHPDMEHRMKTADCEVASATARRLGLSVGVQQGLHQIFERWDGRGVPHGLRGETITLAARFAQVATLAVLLER